MLNSKLRVSGFLILLLILVLGLSIGTTLDSRVKNYFYSLSSPLQMNLKAVSNEVSGWIEAIFSLKELEEENEELKRERNKLLSDNTELSYLKEENEELRKALDLDVRESFKLSLAQVKGKDPDQNEILISKGAEDNIEEGMPVISSQKVLLGKVQKVYQNFSQVRLVSHPEMSFSARVKDKEITGKIQGKGTYLLFDFIPQEKEISEGEVIITSSLGKIFPKGLLIGEIRKISKRDMDPFQKAEIETYFNYEDLFVFIVAGY